MSSQPPDQEETFSQLRSLERKGLEALDVGDFDLAAKLLLDVVTGYERIDDPLLTHSAGYFLGVALAGQGKLEQAALVWEEVIERGWDSPVAFNRLVRYYESRNETAAIQRLFERLHRTAHERTGEFFSYPEAVQTDAAGHHPVADDLPAGTRRLLVGDDEPAVCGLVERAVKPDGFTVLFAFDGRRALRIVLTVRLDAVVLDYFMPGYTGLDVLYRMRAEGLDTPAVIISGRHDPQMVEDAAHLGATWIAKPFTPEALAGTVRRLMQAEATGDSGAESD
ncbi:MAG: response regulator [Acidobacteriota bacterium]